ncbi:MAG TPA: hypothetical protein VFS20_13875 [Longimicrobium sp.]|nr:hypothetical protein [Longimicrobium sp.]
MNPRWLGLMAAAVLAASACAPGAAVPPPAPPAEDRGPPSPPPPAPVAAPVQARTCVVRGGAFTEAIFHYDPATGDSTVNSRLFREVYPIGAEHALVAPWYFNNEPITFRGRRFVKYGLPRVLGSAEAVAAGDHQGVPAFVEPGDDPVRPQVLYLLVDPRCEFQTYLGPDLEGGVRG